MSNLLEKASDLVNHIYECMSKVETCEAISEEIKDLPFVFEGSEKITRMDGVLTPEQMASIREVILQTISSNKVEAEQFLMALTLPDKTKLEETEDSQVVEKDVVQELVQEPSKQEKKELDYAEVKRLYLSEDRTLIDVATELGVSKSTLHRFIQQNGLKKPSKKDAVFRDCK